MTEYLSIAQAAKKTCHSYHAIYRAIKSGKLRAYQPTGKVIISVDDLDEWIKAGEVRVTRKGRPRRAWK